MYYQPKYFSAKELLPESVYQKWGERGLAFLDRDLLGTKQEPTKRRPAGIHSSRAALFRLRHCGP